MKIYLITYFLKICLKELIFLGPKKCFFYSVSKTYIFKIIKKRLFKQKLRNKKKTISNIFMLRIICLILICNKAEHVFGFIWPIALT